MTTSQRALACLELRSIATGYQALAALAAIVDETSAAPTAMKILDASPVGSGFMILVVGPKDQLATAGQKIRAHLDVDSTNSVWKDFAVIEKRATEIAEALFALPRVDLAESMIVAECESVSGLLAVAETLVGGYEIKAIELRILRTSSGGAYGYFTGAAKACAPAIEMVRTRLRDTVRVGRLELIEAPTPAFRAFFNLAGR